MNTFSHIFKKSFLDGFQSQDIDITALLAALGITLFIAVYIFFVYRFITKRTFYSKNFNISLVGVAMITATIIITIQSSIVVSLGMVGALSIVRFRTAVKDPMDLMFLFWSISTGITCGAGHGEFALILAILLTIAVVVLEFVPIAKASMILVINTSDIDSEEKLLKKVSEYAPRYTVKSRNYSADSLDMTVEVKTDRGGELVRSILDVEGVNFANLINHDGEVTF